MRKMLLSLAAAVLLTSACNSAAMPASSGGPPNPGHHNPPIVYPPAATPDPTQPGGVTYEDPGTNPWIDPAQDGESTFGLDVDTASYTIARQYVHDGIAPDSPGRRR